MSKKMRIGISVAAAVLFVAALIFFFVNKVNDDPATGTPDNASIVGTWYSDKPDSVTFTKDGTYSFSAWNGGTPWLTFDGTYTVKGNSVTLQSTQDGMTVLTITTAVDGSITLTGKYTYYKSESAAQSKIQAAEDQAAEDAANIVTNTINNLVGEWTSLDGTTTCVFTETGITVHFVGNDAVPEETLNYEYEIISDKQIKITKNGAAATYPYTLSEKNGTWTFYCTAIEYAPTYTKNSDQPENAAPAASSVVVTDRVISSENKPDKTEYTEELSAYVNEILIGTWKGTFDEWTNADSSYWSYTFSKDGSYTFTDGNVEETGIYTVTSDPNNNYYHSEMVLAFEGGTRTVQFYFTTTDPVKMITDDQTDPTYLKS